MVCNKFLAININLASLYRQCVYGGVWLGLYLLHVAYLSMGERFNYGYNMAVCVTAGVFRTVHCSYIL